MKYHHVSNSEVSAIRPIHHILPSTSSRSTFFEWSFSSKKDHHVLVLEDVRSISREFLRIGYIFYPIAIPYLPVAFGTFKDYFIHFRTVSVSAVCTIIVRKPHAFNITSSTKETFLVCEVWHWQSHTHSIPFCKLVCTVL